MMVTVYLISDPANIPAIGPGESAVKAFRLQLK
jgi:hypothetical protein